MEWKDFESVLRDVWAGEYPKWRAKHMRVDRLSDVNPDLGSITAGNALFGDPLNRHIGFGDTLKSFYANDYFNRTYFRVGHTDDFYRLGLPGRYGIRYVDDNVIVDGEGIRQNSITYDKMLLDARQYNYLKLGEFIQGDGSTYQTCEVDGYGLSMWGVANTYAASPSIVVDDFMGIKWQPVYYFSGSGYEYDTADLKKIALDFYGTNLWGYGRGGSYRISSLTTMGELAEYASGGYSYHPYENQYDSFTFSVGRSGDEFAASMLYYADEEEIGAILMEWSPTGILIQHGDDSPSMLIDHDGVTIRDYLAFHEDSVDPDAPPTGALVYDRANDYYKFRNASGVWRRISDEVV